MTDVQRTTHEPQSPGRKAAFLIWLIPVLFILFICLLRCFYSVDEQHNAVVTQFGRIVKVNTVGFYFKAPWQAVKKVDMTTHGTGIGYVVSSTGQNLVDKDNGIMITSDFNLLNIDFYLEYRVSDPIAYLYNAEDPEGELSNIALANIRTVVSNYTVDEAMTTGKSQIQADVKEAMITELNSRNVGLTVVNITIQDSEPPTAEIIAAFKAVETAKQGADTAMMRISIRTRRFPRRKPMRIKSFSRQTQRRNPVSLKRKARLPDSTKPTRNTKNIP